MTGHRILAQPEKVAAGVDRALDAIRNAFPGRGLLVISMLAEGADRLVAARALRRAGTALHAVLPMARAEYTTDFATAASRLEFDALLRRADQIVELEPRATREAAYAAAGDYLLDRCDALLAVWDGAPALGRGGTGGIVARARERRLPLVWIHAGNRRPGTAVAATLGPEEGRLTLEGF